MQGRGGSSYEMGGMDQVVRVAGQVTEYPAGLEDAGNDGSIVPRIHLWVDGAIEQAAGHPGMLHAVSDKPELT